MTTRVLIGCKNPTETKKCISCIHDKNVFSCMQYMFLNKVIGIYVSKNSEEFKELQYKREMEG